MSIDVSPLSSQKHADITAAQPQTTPDRKYALLVASLIGGLITYDFASTNVAVATLRGALGFSPSTLPWIISAYTLTFGSFLLLAGRLGDVYGRRRVLLTGLTVYVIFSLISAGANSVPLFLFSRVAKGIGAALLAPNALALINSLYAEGKDRHGALARYAVFVSAGYALGNFLGGVLTSYSWRATVLVSAVFSLTAFVLAWHWVRHEQRAAVPGGFDYLGAILSTLGFGTLIFSVSKSVQLGLTSPLTLGFAALSVISLALLYRQINRHPFPLVPPRLLRVRNVIGAAGVVFFLIASGNATFFQISLFMQDVLHYTASETGVGLIPFVLVALLASFCVHMPLNRFGSHKTLVVSLILVLLFVLSFLNLDATSTYWLGLIPGLVLWDTAFPFASISTRVPAGYGLPAADQGIANGINFAAEQLGSAFGITLLAAVSAAGKAAHNGDAVAGFHWAFIVSGFLMVAAVLIAAFVLRSQPAAARAEIIPDLAPLGGVE